MPRRKSRQEIMVLNDDRLLAAGRAVFLSEGYHGASLDRVSAAAGLTKGAVYARFASKADLFLTLLAAHIEERLIEARQVVQRARTVRGASRAALLQWVERTEKNRDWTLLTLEFRLHALRDPALLRRYQKVHARLRNGMTALAEELAERTGERPPLPADALVRVLVALGTGWVLERWADADNEHDAVLDRVVARLFDEPAGRA